MALRRTLRRAALLALVALAVVARGAGSPSLAQPPQSPARVALIHAAPLDGDSLVTVAVALDASDTRVAALGFGETRSYLDLPPGARAFKLFAGDLPQEQLAAATPLLETTLSLLPGADYTVAAVGGANDFPLELLAVPDSPLPAPSAAAQVRVAHLAPFARGVAATAVDVVTETGQAVPPLLDLAFKSVSPFAALPADTELDLKIVPAGQPGATPVLDLPPRSFVRGQLLTLAVLGGANGYEPRLLELALAPRAPARLQVLNAAPGDENAQLSLLVNGSRRVNELAFGASVELADLVEGPYSFVVERPGTPPGQVASAELLLSRATDYLALIRPRADGLGVMLVVEPELPLGQSPLPPGFGYLVIYHVAPLDTGDRSRLDLRDQLGRLVADQTAALAFGERRVVALPAREYDLRFTSVGGDELLTRLPPFTLQPGEVATVFAVGGLDSTQVEGRVIAETVRARLFLPFMVD